MREELERDEGRSIRRKIVSLLRQRGGDGKRKGDAASLQGSRNHGADYYVGARSMAVCRWTRRDG